MKHKIKVQVKIKHFNKKYDGTTYTDMFGTFPNYTYSYYNIDVFIKRILNAFEDIYKDEYWLEIDKLKLLSDIDDSYSLEFKTNMNKQWFKKFLIALHYKDTTINKGFAYLEIK